MVSLEKRSTFEIILKGWQISTSDFQSWVFNKDLMKSLHSCRHIFSPAQQNMKQRRSWSQKGKVCRYLFLSRTCTEIWLFFPPPTSPSSTNNWISNLPSSRSSPSFLLSSSSILPRPPSIPVLRACWPAETVIDLAWRLSWALLLLQWLWTWGGLLFIDF